MRLKLIACEILCRELCAALPASPHRIDVEFLPKALHDIAGAGMCEQLQQRVDAAEGQGYEAILLGYALCGNGVKHLAARSAPLILPRAHDCIALLMGSREAYQQYFDAHSGVYYRSPGWVERGEASHAAFHMTMEELIAKYGEDNAQYLYDTLYAYQRNYNRLTYIDTGGDPDGAFEASARAEAVTRGWEYDRVAGSSGWFERLLSGPWEGPDFLIVPPGKRIVPRYDEQIVATEEA